MKKLICLLMATMVLSGCAQEKPEPTKEAKNSVGCDVTSECEEGEIADMSGYESFMDTEHVYRSITMAEGNVLLESDKTFVLYYGFATCPWCVELLPVLNDVAKENDFAVHYVNVRPEGTDSSFDIRLATNPDYVRLTELVNDFLPMNDEGVKRLSVPFVFYVKNGEIINTHIGTLDTHDATERLMTPEEVLELEKIVQGHFQELKK